jgi:hypothetical protein|tara:strand:- start:8555 stop:9025 length:471 start_codon:yes stop_codon:yes gene_type:complete
MGNKERHPINITRLLNCNNMANPIISWRSKKIIAPLLDTLFDARGLFFVLSTFLSKSLSKKSFHVHPAPRIIIDPIKNNIKKLIGGNSDILTPYINKDQIHGQKSSIKPIGLSYRASSTHGDTSLYKTLRNKYFFLFVINFPYRYLTCYLSFGIIF